MDFGSSTRAAENMTKWKVIVSNSSVVPLQPSKLWDRMDYAPVKIVRVNKYLPLSVRSFPRPSACLSVRPFDTLYDIEIVLSISLTVLLDLETMHTICEHIENVHVQF